MYVLGLGSRTHIRLHLIIKDFSGDKTIVLLSFTCVLSPVCVALQSLLLLILVFLGVCYFLQWVSQVLQEGRIQLNVI